MPIVLQVALVLAVLLIAAAHTWAKVQRHRDMQDVTVALNRLEASARDSRVSAAEAIRVKELATAIAQVDHTQLLRLLSSLGVRIETGNDMAARMEVAAAGVADDLAAAHARADAILPSEPHGASADAAMRSE